MPSPLSHALKLEIARQAERLEKKLVEKGIPPQFIAGTERERTRTMASMRKLLESNGES